MELKPFQIILMAAFGFIALVGIFLFANFKGFSSGVAPVGKVTIWGTLPGGAFTETLNTLKQNHAEYGQVSYEVRPAATFDADLADAIASGVGPDLIIISQEQLAAEQNKINLIPSSSIPERTFRDTYLPEHELYLAPGGTYGIPLVLDPLMLYYNRPQLASVGAAVPPSTWEAVTGLAPALTHMSDTQSIQKSGVALGTYDNIENARGILSLLFLQAGYTISERSQDRIVSTLAKPPSQSYVTSPAESALSFYTQFANPAKTVYSWNRTLPSARDAFLAGDLSLYLGYASEQPQLAASNPNLDFDMAPAPGPGVASARMTYGRAYAFAIPKASPNASGAFRIAMSLTEKTTLTKLAHALHMVPAQRALLIPAAGDLYEPVYFPEALIAKGWLSPAPGKTDSILGTMVGNVESGRQSVHDAITTASQALNAAY